MNPTNAISQMQDIVDLLNEACRAYYDETGDGPIMPDVTYDKYIADLRRVEDQTGIVLPDSPTRRVGFPTSTEDKMSHVLPVLSLKSTKSIDELLYFLGESEGVLSWKLDGMSVILYYSGGILTHALTRGDGAIGKVITKNVRKMLSVPSRIRYSGTLVVRGEACVSLPDFEHIKRTKEGERYSNPRNLAAGIIASGEPSTILLKRINFIAHSIVYQVGDDFEVALTHRTDEFAFLKELGFQIVPHVRVLNFELRNEVKRLGGILETESYLYPTDGLVLALNDLALGDSLGSTQRFPKHSLALKWPDISTTTTVTGMKWSVSRTGLITPVVLVAPVTLEGTTVRQVNLHNLKFFEGLSIGVGDILKIYKANKIVPEVEENFTRSKLEEYPRVCPVCETPTEVVKTERTKKLYCRNPKCKSRH